MPRREFPRSFIYLSKRIVQSQYERLEADQPAWKLDAAQFRPPALGAGVSAARVTPSSDNYYWMAKRVTAALRHETGTLENPRQFVRAKLPLRWGRLYTGCLQPDGTHPKVWIGFFTGNTKGIVAADLILFGSTGNFEGMPTPVAEDEEWKFAPSTDAGLGNIIRAFSAEESDDLNAALKNLPERTELVKAAAEHKKYFRSFEEAAGFTEVLFYVFGFTRESQSINGNSVEEIIKIVGAPLWVAQCLPQDEI